MGFRPLARDGKRRSARLPNCRVSSDFKEKFDVFWKKAEFVDIEGNIKKFTSAGDFQEFVFKILIGRGEQGWNMLAHQKLKPVFF